MTDYNADRIRLFVEYNTLKELQQELKQRDRSILHWQELIAHNQRIIDQIIEAITIKESQEPTP